MAPPTDKRKLAELAAFVNELADMGGYVSHADWARESGYPAPNLSELRNGVAGIDGYNLLRLIQAVAKRVEQSEAVVVVSLPRAEGDRTPDVLDFRLRELEAKVDRHGEAATKTLEGLVADVERILDQLAAQGGQASDQKSLVQ